MTGIDWLKERKGEGPGKGSKEVITRRKMVFQSGEKCGKHFAMYTCIKSSHCTL